MLNLAKELYRLSIYLSDNNNLQSFRCCCCCCFLSVTKNKTDCTCRSAPQTCKLSLKFALTQLNKQQQCASKLRLEVIVTLFLRRVQASFDLDASLINCLNNYLLAAPCCNYFVTLSLCLSFSLSLERASVFVAPLERFTYNFLASGSGERRASTGRTALAL